MHEKEEEWLHFGTLFLKLNALTGGGGRDVQGATRCRPTMCTKD